MRRFLIVAGIFILFVRAEGAEYLAVLPCQIEAEGYERASTPIHYTLIERATKLTSYEVMTRENIFTIMREKNLEPEKCAEAQCAVDYGRYLGAERVMTCTISKVGERIFVYITLYDTETGRVIASERDSCRCTPDELVDFVGGLGEKVFSSERVGRGEAQLFIKAETPDIYFEIDGGSISGRVQTERIVYLKPGSHRIRFNKDGYETVEEEFYVESGRVKTITALLPPKTERVRETGEGYLDIVSEPDGAEITIDGKPLLNPDGSPKTTPVTLSLQAGEHTIILKRALYKPHLANVIVRAGGFERHSVKLEPNYGTLHIESSPPQADVYIDGVKRGITPLTLDEMESKAYIVKVSKSLYHDVQETVYVKPMQTTVKNFMLPPAFGSIRITGTEGAEVLIDGKVEGTVPFYKEVVLPGEHIIEVRKKLHQPFRRTVKVSEGDTVNLTANLIENYGIISVVSNIKDAPIRVDGELAGKGEVNEYKVDAGEHTIEAGDPEIHRVWRARIAVGRMERKRYTADVRFRTGDLIVITEPREAEIYIDGEKMGLSPTKLTLVRGEHRILLRKEGYTDVEERVRVEEGEIKEFRVSLPRFKPAKLILKIRPSGEVYINGRKEGEGKEVEITVPARREVEVLVRKEGYREKRFSLSLEPEERKYEEVVLSMKPPLGVLLGTFSYIHPPVQGEGGGFEINFFPSVSFLSLGFSFNYIYGGYEDFEGHILNFSFPVDLRIYYLMLRGEGYVYYFKNGTSGTGGGFAGGGGFFYSKKPFEVRLLYTYSRDISGVRFEMGWVF